MNIHQFLAAFLAAIGLLLSISLEPIAFSQEEIASPTLKKQLFKKFEVSSVVKNFTIRPWDLSPELESESKVTTIPGWIDPVPHNFNNLQIPDREEIPGWVDPVPETFENIKFPEWDVVKFLKENPPKQFAIDEIRPDIATDLPWYSLNLIPKVPTPKVVVEDLKVLTPMITGSFEIEGRIAIFKTTDTHLYYVVPNRWQVSMNGYAIDDVQSKNGSRKLRFLLSPSYSWAYELVEKIKKKDKNALFVPLPKKIVGFRLDVPEELGEVKNQILPTDGMSIGDNIYMSLEVDDEAVKLFEILNKSKSYLTGSVKFTYPYDKLTSFELISDIWLNI
ncbi:MAG: hypothetical protein EOP04_07570 [Proteobacteria bacterium]|nr:MAG: hypothetical protein EOP04_07570 [Pseudomonadota bacterium]